MIELTISEAQRAEIEKLYGLENVVVDLRYRYKKKFLSSEPLVQQDIVFYNGRGQTYCLIARSRHEAKQILEHFPPTTSDLSKCLRFARDKKIPLLNLKKPLQLSPLRIAKPWGQEIWYTGMEARGEARVKGLVGEVALSLLLSLFPKILLGRFSNMILVKILDPLPQEVIGELYLELHEKKEEVYIISHLDQRAWPKGVGEMYYGVDKKKIAALSVEKAKAEIMAAIKAYESIRRKIDRALNEQRTPAKQNEVLSPKENAALIKTLPRQWIEEERALRKNYQSYFGKISLRVGDVVKVPTCVPHSLRHGIRSVEFQTPVYERLIVAFAQEVLTQSHWDTQKACELMDLDHPYRSDLTALGKIEEVLFEKIVTFSDFEVLRITAEKEGQLDLDNLGFIDIRGRYILAFGLRKTVLLEAEELQSAVYPEECYLLPARSKMRRIIMPGGSICLIAYPL